MTVVAQVAGEPDGAFDDEESLRTEAPGEPEEDLDEGAGIAEEELSGDLAADVLDDGALQPAGDEEDGGTVDTSVVAPDAAFDDDEDEELVAVVTGDDEDDDEIAGLRDGEFVCRSCHLAMRDTQLADPQRMICRDCV